MHIAKWITHNFPFHNFYTQLSPQLSFLRFQTVRFSFLSNKIKYARSFIPNAESKSKSNERNQEEKEGYLGETGGESAAKEGLSERNLVGIWHCWLWEEEEEERIEWVIKKLKESSSINASNHFLLNPKLSFKRVI